MFIRSKNKLSIMFKQSWLELEFNANITRKKRQKFIKTARISAACWCQLLLQLRNSCNCSLCRILADYKSFLRIYTATSWNCCEVLKLNSLKECKVRLIYAKSNSIVLFLGVPTSELRAVLFIDRHNSKSSFSTPIHVATS